MAEVTFDEDVGGDGSTVSDDDDPSTGLRAGGYMTRFVPALQQLVAIAIETLANAAAALASATAAAASAVTAAAAADAATLPTFTWAGKPSAASYSGRRIRITDVGLAPGLIIVSDGTNWRPDGVQVLARSGTNVAGGANTTENTLVTVTIPAGLLGTAGSLRLRYTGNSSGSANGKTWRVRFSGAAGTVMHSLNVTATSYTHGATVLLQNEASASAQRAEELPDPGVASSTYSAASVDTSVATTLLITAQKLVTAGDTMNLRRYVLEVLP